MASLRPSGKGNGMMPMKKHFLALNIVCGPLIWLHSSISEQEHIHVESRRRSRVVLWVPLVPGFLQFIAS